MTKHMLDRAGAGVLLATLALSQGCRTTEDVLSDYEKNFSAGAYALASQEVSELAGDRDSNEQLWHLHAGAALMFAGDSAAAVEQFHATEDAFEAEDAKSVFARGGEGALAMLGNDMTFDYDGGGQDRIFTCLYKAQVYASLGDSDSARTELNRADAHQDKWLFERGKDIEAARERLESESSSYRKEKGEAEAANTDRSATASAMSDYSFATSMAEGCGFDPRTSGRLEALSRNDYFNAYASHFNGVFRWVDGTGGRELLAETAALRPANSVAARDAAEARAGAAPASQVWVYVEDGLCPKREEWRIDLPTALIPGLNRYVLYTGMAFPKLAYRPFAGLQWNVKTSGASVPLEVLQDVDALMKTEYDVYMRGAIAREIMRTIVKTGTQIALGIAEDNADGYAKWGLLAARVAAAGWHAGTVGADIRSWTSLPKIVFVARLDRPADGRLDISCTTQTIPVQLAPGEGNAAVFVRLPSAQAVPSVRIVELKTQSKSCIE